MLKIVFSSAMRMKTHNVENPTPASVGIKNTIKPF